VSIIIHAAMCLQAGQNLKEATGNDVGSQAKSGVRLSPLSFPAMVVMRNARDLWLKLLFFITGPQCAQPLVFEAT